MTEKQFKDLLKTLKIGFNKSNVEIKELLDAKLNEYLDRQDESATDMVSDIQDALDYVEELIDRIGGGIALAPDESDKQEDIEEINRELLGQAAKNDKKGVTTFAASANASGQAGRNASNGANMSVAAGVNPKSKPWFYSVKGDSSVDDMFELAERDLRIGDFSHAVSVFDTILKNEMTNPGAYMGKVLATYKLQEPKDIATCYTKGLENYSDLKRAESCGNDKQKKFVQDALEERRKAMIYIDADKVLNTSTDVEKLLDTAKDFESIGTYRDATKKANECRKKAKTLKALAIRKKVKKVLSIVAVVIIAGVLFNFTIIDQMTSGGGIGNVLKFGEIYIEGNQQDQTLEGYPNIKKATIENAAYVYVNNCQSLKEVTVKGAERTVIYASKKTEKVKVDSVEDLTVQGWDDGAQLENIEVSNVKKVKIMSAYKVEDWKFEGGIEKLELYGCDGLSDVVVGKDVKDMIFRSCNGSEGFSFEDGFAGKITFDICDVEKILVPSAASEINIKICDSLGDVSFENGFAGDILIDGSESICSIFVPKDTKSVFFRSCPELTSVTFEEGFAGDVYVSLCEGLTTDNFAIPEASKNVTIQFCENLEDYSRYAEE